MTFLPTHKYHPTCGLEFSPCYLTLFPVTHSGGFVLIFVDPFAPFGRNLEIHLVLETVEPDGHSVAVNWTCPTRLRIASIF